MRVSYYNVAKTMTSTERHEPNLPGDGQRFATHRETATMRDISIVIVFTAIAGAILGCDGTRDNGQDVLPMPQPDNRASNGNQAPVLDLENGTPAESTDDDTAVSAADLFAAGRYVDAFEAYKNRIKEEPTNQAILYNAGQCAYLIGQYDDAAEAWLALEKIAGDRDLGVKEKLIQTFEQLDQPDEVEKRIAELAEIRQNTEDPKYKQKKSFCRDQFTIGAERFIVHHHFDFPTGDESRFTAYCADGDGKTKFSFRFWSSATTNAIAREHGELKEDERLYHIDEYRAGSKTNHLHTKNSLSYREFKTIVTDLVNTRRN